MGVSTTAKRGDARSAPSRPSHVKREVIGVLLIAAGLLILLSLVSFVPGDAKSMAASGAAGTQPKNMIGSVGALSAAACFFLVGGAAYLFPILLGLLGARCFTPIPLTVRLRHAGSGLVAMVFLSGLLHLEVTAVPTISSGWVNRGLAGGIVGQVLADGIRGYFATTGAHIVILTGLMVALLFTVPLSLTLLLQRLPDWWTAARERMAGLIPDWPVKQESPTSQPKRARVKVARPPREMGEPELDREVQVVAEAVEQIAAPVIPPKIQPPMKVEKRATTSDESAPAVATSPSVSDGYVLPDPQELLSDPSGPIARLSDDELKLQSEILTKALKSFAIEGRVTEVRPGPVVTMYEFEPAPGTKVARIVNLADDLALALKAISLRIVAPLPGKSVVGIEVPNPHREMVSMKEVVTSDAFSRSRSKLSLALGKDIFGGAVCADLKTMPHLLVAGATGAGKSVGLNTMLLSILFSARPDEVKLLLIDPKMLEFQSYDGIPHLLRPVITDPKSAARGLGWVVQEMERRYKLLAEAGVRSIDAYNRRISEVQGAVSDVWQSGKPEQVELTFLSEEERLSKGEDAEPAGDNGPRDSVKASPPEPLPYIMVMIDELADLMMVAPKDVEDKIARLAQMARASGIHLVLATQRPSVDVLTGLIKANFPARIAFQVSSKTDSRTILDANGAEALLGRGDMLYLASGTGKLMRIHGSFVSDDDVRRVVEFVKKQALPSYCRELQSLKVEEAEEEQAKDEVYEQAKDLVLSTGQASASLIQRRLRVGYPRAARMIEQMEADGVVGAAGRDGRREVLGRRGPVGGDEE
ncbi:DNA translocase FtsK [Nitrospira defluvii]|uniref:Cell division protein FtsK n=1 Tax=Nitrospira defluvii TaxID=330214 RepID=A0ABM8QKC9_9BACT|nr:DNA translocase FtsK [Nitrospira defluvii]CAE6701326.1 Cell division protein FtsK [Nitrospira defluvii]